MQDLKQVEGQLFAGIRGLEAQTKNIFDIKTTATASTEATAAMSKDNSVMFQIKID